MRVSDAFPSQYLRATDLQGRTAQVTISHVSMEKIGQDNKPVVYFQGKEKGLVLNKTNASKVADAYGDDMDEWEGAIIQIFPTVVDFKGESVDAIRIKIPPRSPQAQRPAPPPAVPAADEAPFYDDAIPF